MFETYPKNGPRQGRKVFKHEKGAKFAPDAAKPEYQQVGSKDRYPHRGGANQTHEDAKAKNAVYAKAGGNAQVSLTPGNKNHQNNFGTVKKAPAFTGMADSPKKR